MQMITIQYEERLATHCNLVPGGICVESSYYHSVQFVRKKCSSCLSVKILKHCIQGNLSMCTLELAKTNHSCTVRTAAALHGKDGRQIINLNVLFLSLSNIFEMSFSIYCIYLLLTRTKPD